MSIGKEVVEASTIGIPAGSWPETLRHDGVVFERVRGVHHEGELVAVIYRCGQRVLEVLND